jgi:hypothetical protein
MVTPRVFQLYGDSEHCNPVDLFKIRTPFTLRNGDCVPMLLAVSVRQVHIKSVNQDPASVPPGMVLVLSCMRSGCQG